MNMDDIERMVKESDFIVLRSGIDGKSLGVMNYEHLGKFASLVAAAEREACAKVCESLNEDFDSLHVESCAEAIRARGQE